MVRQRAGRQQPAQKTMNAKRAKTAEMSRCESVHGKATTKTRRHEDDTKRVCHYERHAHTRGVCFFSRKRFSSASLFLCVNPFPPYPPYPPFAIGWFSCPPPRRPP